MDILCKEIQERHSCRIFKNNELVPGDIITALLTAASMAPSGKNSQPWRFKIIEDSDFSNQLSAILPNNKWVKNVTQLILVFLDTTYSYNILKDSMAIGACIENMLIEAKSRSVDTCWIGECTDYADNISKLLDIDVKYTLMSIIAVGYSKIKSNSPQKKQLNELLI